MLLSLPAREVKSYKTMKILETEVGYLNKKVNIAFIALTRPSHFFQKSLAEKHAHPPSNLPLSHAAMRDCARRLTDLPGRRGKRSERTYDVSASDTRLEPRLTAPRAAKRSSGLGKSVPFSWEGTTP